MRFAGVLLAAGLGIAAVAHAADPVTATLTVDASAAVVEMTIASGWHVNAHEPRDRFLIPTTVTLAPPTGMTAAAVQYPPPVEKALAFAEGKRLLLYEGTVRMDAKLDGAPADASPVHATLRYQACNDSSCLPPRTIELSAPARAAHPSHAPRADEEQVAGWIARLGWAGTLLQVLLLGMALNLTPCVYPLISVTLAFFGGRTGHDRGVALRATAYVAGITFTFTALGALAALTGSLFGAALQQPAVLGAIAALMALLAVGNFGLYQVRLPSGVMQWASRTGEGVAGCLFMGLTMGVVAAPCIAPIVVALLLYVGARQEVLPGVALFFALGLGIGLPYLVLALLADRLRRLPRSGPWLVWMERLFGFLLLGLALHFATPLLSPELVRAAWTALVVVAGLVLGFFGAVRSPVLWWTRAAAGVAVALVGARVLLATEVAPGVAWTAFSDDALAQARAAGRPVLIDFQALWCIPCREMERTTFHDPTVVQRARDFATLKADVTEDDERTTALQARFDVQGVPTYVLLDREGHERRRFVGFVAAEALAQALAEVARGG